MIKKLFIWIFKEEYSKLQQSIGVANARIQELELLQWKFENTLGNIDVSVDHHIHSASWAVISIQGTKTDYIKFIDLGERDIRDIKLFLQRFDRRKVDTNPAFTKYFKIDY